MSLHRELAPTGTLRAAINLGNPVLAQGTVEAPAGVTVDLAREFARRLDVPLQLHCVDAARKSFAALTEAAVDIAFLAVDPARADQVSFTAPYVVIEGAFAVPRDSDFTAPADVDREGVRVGVKQGSAYDLFLTRTLQHATVVRGRDGVDAFREGGLEVAAGIREPLREYVAAHPELRLLDERFMQIRQAVALPHDRSPAARRFLASAVEELKAGGFVRAALDRSGRRDAAVAPPA